jgi:hypothetical protein
MRNATIRIRKGKHWKIKPEAKAMDGRRVRFSFGWQITKEDSSIYVGEDACILHPEDCREGEPIWIASGDLDFRSGGAHD